jgi:hypothetical protein
MKSSKRLRNKKMEKVIEKSIKIYNFILSNFNGTISDEIRKKVRDGLKGSEEILNRRRESFKKEN